MSSGSGVKKHPLFFLDPILRRRRRGPAGLAEEASHSEYVVPEAPADEPGDVRAQREYAEHSADRSRTPIIAYRLGKTYPGRDGAPPKVACRNFSLAIPKGEVFGLLGPNGAGKSTSINMLIGFLAPSSGTAFIEWLDIREEMDTVYTLLGVCPQVRPSAALLAAASVVGRFVLFSTAPSGVKMFWRSLRGSAYAAAHRRPRSTTSSGRR